MQTHFDPDRFDVVALLRECGVVPTAQREAIARLVFTVRKHLSAEDVYRLVNSDGRRVSKATVYNTLGLLATKGVVREVIVDAGRVFYDPNTKPHHHFYDVTTGELRDIDASQIQISGFPDLPEGKALDGIDVIVRLR